MSTTGKHHNEGFLALVNDAKSRVREIDIDEYKRRLASGEKFLTIERDIETKIPDKSSTLVLYCGGGFRSALAADSIQKMGYSNVISLDGGWRAYQNAGLPVEK